MQPVTPLPRPRAPRGRWLWLLSGVGCTALLAVPLVRVATGPWGGIGPDQEMSALPAKTFTIGQRITNLNVESYGAPIRVTGEPGDGPVKVTESMSFGGSTGAPAVTDRVSHGRLTLAAPACAEQGCSVAFTVTVPAGVAVTADGDGGSVAVTGAGTTAIDSAGGPVLATRIQGPLQVTADGGGVTVDGAASTSVDSGGGPVTVSAVTGKLNVQAGGGGVTVTGADATTIDSGGGPVSASGITGPLTVTADGGGVQLDQVTGALNVDTGGGPLDGTQVSAPTTVAQAEGGGVTLAFGTAPSDVQVDTGGGPANLSLPGGPYAVTAYPGGGPELMLITPNPAAPRVIKVSTEGGGLQIGPG